MKIIELSDYVKDNRTWGNYQCYCGKEFTTRKQYVKSGRTKSCGCLQREMAVKQGKKVIHGLENTPEHSVWISMLSRCRNPHNISYKYYGERGITVCERWSKDYVMFYKDMGKRPSPTHQIDRIDTNGNYEPDNCRWVTPEENCANRSTSKFIEYDGKRLTYSQWARENGMKKETLISRIRDGWEPIRAITTPVRIKP